MRERPIKLEAWEVRAILRGRKTQIRPVLRPQPPSSVVRVRGPYPFETRIDGDDAQGHAVWFANASCRAGDRLYVRESLRFDEAGGVRAWTYQADGTPLDLRAPAACEWAAGRMKSVPAHAMPRWASRLTLAVTAVRIVRLQDISEDDSIAEGVQAVPVADIPRPAAWSAKTDFAAIWNSLHGPEAWAANPWVVAVTFHLEKATADVPAGRAA